MTQVITPTEDFFFRSEFSKVIASGTDSNFFNVVGSVAAGMGVSQSAGNLVITAGTTANQETILRSVRPFCGNFVLRSQNILSQRIVNNNFFVELVDTFGDGLAFTINSTTSVTVTFPTPANGPYPTNGHPWDATSVGQFVNLGALTGTAGTIPGRYAIASVSANTVTFTVASWPATGSGTCSVFGWNYHHVLFDGATATNAKYDAQKNGWATGDTTLTINTTVSPGTMMVVDVDDGVATVADCLVATATAQALTPRGSRLINMPDRPVNLFLQIRSMNGTTNPASGTTWTIGNVIVDQYVAQAVSLSSIRPQSYNASIPVTINGQAMAAGAGVQVQGAAAVNSATPGNPLFIATGQTASPTAVTSGRNVALMATSIGAIVNRPFAVPELDWSFAGASGGIVNTTTAVTLKTAAGASVRNYLTGLQISSDTLGSATEVVVRDGAAGTVIWRHKLSTTAVADIEIVFATPLKSTANTLLEVATLTATVTGGVFVNAQGYTAP